MEQSAETKSGRGRRRERVWFGGGEWESQDDDQGCSAKESVLIERIEWVEDQQQ